MKKTKIIINDTMTKKLIREVKSRPYLWNPAHDQYNDRIQLVQAWNEISNTLELPEFALKGKWKNLRDVFKRDLKKFRMEGRDNRAYSVRWRHFKAMSFIETSTQSDEILHKNANFLEEPEICDIKLEIEEYPTEDKAETYSHNVIVETKGVEKTNENTCDDYDMMYLQSLTPFFKELDPMRKLFVRNKMQELLMLEIAAQNEERALHGSAANNKYK